MKDPLTRSCEYVQTQLRRYQASQERLTLLEVENTVSGIRVNLPPSVPNIHLCRTKFQVLSLHRYLASLCTLKYFLLYGKYILQLLLIFETHFPSKIIFVCGCLLLAFVEYSRAQPRGMT